MFPTSYGRILPKREYPKESLMENVDLIQGSIIICGEQGLYRNYYHFVTPDLAYEFILNNKNKDITFHENVKGEFLQKFRLDIDIDLKEYPDWNNDQNELFLNVIISSIYELYQQYDITLISDDIRVYDSSGEDKFSYHIVIDNYVYVGNIRGRFLLKELIKIIKNKNIEGFDEKWVDQFFDMGVYSSLQSFRLFGSKKQGTNRIKLQKIKFNFLGNEIIRERKFTKDEFLKSLLSNHYNCKVIKGIKIDFYSKDEVNYNIDPDIINKVKYILQERNEVDCFEILSLKGMKINLKRLKPTYCEVCQRTHHKQNPYLSLSEAGIYFNCRRSDCGGYKISDTNNVIKKNDENFNNGKKIKLEPFLRIGDNIIVGNEDIGYKNEKKSLFANKPKIKYINQPKINNYFRKR